MRSVLTLVVAALALTSTVVGIRRKDVLKMKPLPHAGGQVKSVHVESGEWATGPLPYKGGPVKTGQIPVYLLFYGDWDADSSAVPLFTTFINGIGATPWWEITKLYKDSQGNVAGSGGLVVKGTHNDRYSAGNHLNYNSLEETLRWVIYSGGLPVDPSGIYAFLTSSDVTIDGFCHTWCAYHYFFDHFEGDTIQYVVAGNAANQCISTCSGNINASPNGNLGVDAMINALAHEIDETVTDPNLNAWTFNNETENADLCNFNFGQKETLSSGAFYNIAFAGYNWLIQQMWNPTTNRCVMTV